MRSVMKLRTRQVLAMCLCLLVGGWASAQEVDEVEVKVGEDREIDIQVTPDDADGLPPVQYLSEPKDCVNLRDIDRTRIVNNQQILFYLRRNRVYLNQLPHKCGGLRRNDTLSYKTSLNRLCRLDSITVLNQSGFGFTRGPTCGLGYFQEIDEATADFLKEAAKRR